MTRFIFALFLMSLALAAPSAAQHNELGEIELQASGVAYLRATRLRGLDRSVAYFDPNRPPPPFETRQPDRGTESGAPSMLPSAGPARTTTLLLTGMIMLGIVYLFVTYSGGLSVSLRQEDDGAATKERRGGPNNGSNSRHAIGLDAILSMPDRREALVALCRSLLARVVTAEGVLLHKSWTDRDTLRRVPRDHPQHGALQQLVFASERVQFGGRDVTEQDLKDHVDRLRALWSTKAAP